MLQNSASAESGQSITWRILRTIYPDMYCKTSKQQIFDDRRRLETDESTLAEDLSDSLSHEKT